MKSAKIVRPIDNNGRIVLPKNLITDILKAKPDEHISVEVFYTDDSIVLKRFHFSCSFCNENKNLKEFQGLKICPTCLEKIKKL